MIKIIAVRYNTKQLRVTRCVNNRAISGNIMRNQVIKYRKNKKINLNLMVLNKKGLAILIPESRQSLGTDFRVILMVSDDVRSRVRLPKSDVRFRKSSLRLTESHKFL